MKIAVWALIVVGIYFVYQATAGKIFREYQGCYDEAVAELANSQQSISNSCVLEKLIYDEMNECVSTVQQNNNFSGFLYEASKAKKLIEADVEVHNEACPGNAVDSPQQSFYLPAGTNR